MTVLEIIRLRLAGGPPDELVEDICRSIAASDASTTVKIYHHATISTDLGVHICRRAVGGVVKPSALGLSLAAALREHGMVEHTLWNEEACDDING